MKIRKLAPFFVILLILPGLFNGCKKVEDGLSSIIWQINFDLVTTTWDIQFIDAATGLPIGANSEDQTEVTITGNDQPHILDLAGIRQPVFYSTRGFMALALHPNRLSPGALTPVSFVIHASHPAYLPVHVPVLSYSAGINPIRVFMVSKDHAPLNVDLLTQTAAGHLADGRLSDSLKLYTSANLASVELPSGTEIHAASGAQLAGSLTFAFSYWEGGTVNGLKMLPGGQISVSSAGTPGLIYPAGAIYTGITDEDGKTAATLSRPVKCSALISRSVYNPATKAKLTAGELVPVWFMNPATGIWENQGTTILQAFQNKLLANFEMNIPGLYLLGWINENLCTSPLTMHPVTLPEYSAIPYAFAVNIFEVYGEELRFIRTTDISGQVTEDYSMRFLPDNSELVFRFEAYTGEDKPYYRNPDPILLAGFCESGTPAEFDLLPKPNSTYKKIEVVFIDVEHNNTRYNPKVFPGYYRKTGATTWQSAFVYGGQAFMINPREGDLYEMGINFKGKLHLKEVTVGPEEVVLVEIAID